MYNFIIHATRVDGVHVGGAKFKTRESAERRVKWMLKEWRGHPTHEIKEWEIIDLRKESKR